MRYFFILGKNNSLSSAEIIAYFEKLKINFSFLTISSEAVIVKTKEPINVKEAMLSLGGTIKIGEIVSELQKVALKDIVKNFEITPKEKIFFGFSFYNLSERISPNEFKKMNQTILKLGMQVKKFLKEKNCSSRLVVSKDLSLSSVVVDKNKLLPPYGSEIVFLFGKGKIYLGKTLAVQEFEEYSFRDYGRPARDMRVGLMPPKLAKIMINLAKIDFGQTILDPFCGFGTILGEAMLLGYKNLIGSDINAATLDGARENLEWLAKNYELRIKNYELFESDVQRISEKLSPHSVDAIITEPYLGPPLSGREPLEKIEQIIDELSYLYLAAFREFKKILKPNGRIVILFPVFHLAFSPPLRGRASRLMLHPPLRGRVRERGATARLSLTGEGWGEGKDKFLPILDSIKKIGFEKANPLPQEFKKYSFIKITPRNSIIYFRPGQFVWREVLIFQLSRGQK